MAGSSQKSSTRAVDKQAEEFKALRNPFADLLSGSFGDISAFMSGDLNYGGVDNLDNYRAGITPGEEGALANIQSLVGGSANEALSGDLLSKTIEGEFLSPETNPGLRDLLSYTNQAISGEFDNEDLAQRALFARAGQVLPESSPFAQASMNLSKARMDAIGKNTSAILASAYESERGRQVQAVEQTRANAAFELERSLESFRASSLPRLIDEMGFDRGFEEYTNRINVLSQALGLLGQITAPALATVGKTKSSGGGLSLSGGSQGAAGAAS